jgi:hypothetical protein
MLDLAGSEARVCVQAPTELCDRRRDALGGGVRDHDLGRVRARARDAAFQGDEALLAGEAVRESGDPARPDVHPEDRQREREQ